MKNTKKKVLSSILALMLCFAMLLGTTWAWFTDSVTSDDNKIVAGNLKIDLELLDKEDVWKSIKENKDPIFTYDNWEPGYTDVTILKVENEGTLSLKWEARFVSDNEVSKLAEVIDVWVKPSATELSYPTDRADISADNGWQMVGTLDKFIDTLSSTTYGSLLPFQSAYLGIALHMQEDAGNEYQTIGLDAFDIQIVATQLASEEDSFGPDYDNDAEWPEGKMNFTATTDISNVATINGELAEEVIIRHESGAYAVVPAGTKLADGVTELKFSGKDVDGNGNFADDAKNYDIHIEGIADDNTKCIKVFIGEILPAGLGETELKLYHENDQMTRVNSVNDFAINNQFTYDPATGAVVLYVDNFSVFSAVQTSAYVWDGTYDISWYNTTSKSFTLDTAEKFAGFRAIVDGGYYTVANGVWTWNEVTQDSFAGKTVQLGVDINLNNTPFDPIGKGYAHKGGQVFMGTFDGGNHTIYNLYQNCWELDPDKTNYSTYTYSTAGAGLFASIKDATIKNLSVSVAEIVFECVDMGIVVGYAQGTCHFENIVVSNSKIANYNRYTGGVVGEVSFGPYGTDTSKGYSHTFKNVVVDSSVKVCGLWGSFGCGMGGVIGGKWGDATVMMENVISAPVMDVYNDVVSAYQWYAFRGCGMLIGHTEEPYSDGRTSGNATAGFLTCKNVDVYYGDWVNYHYYEFENQDNTTGQRYPWVRAEAGEYCEAFSNIRYGVPTHNGKKVSELTEEELKEIATDYTPIVFDQLYGADRGMYGTATHEGVTTTHLTDTRTIYFQNNWNWTNLKIHYWYSHGDDRWTTVVDGISLTGMSNEKLGEYDLYKFDIPAYVAGFYIEGYDSTTATTHSTGEVDSTNIIDGNIYWFIFANTEYSLVTSKYENGTFQTHDIYLVGKNINSWTVSDEWRLTPSENGKTWTGTFTIDKADEVKLYNALVIDNNASYISQEGILNNANTPLAPGKYVFTYNVEKNTFTFDMIERILYLNPTSYWTNKNARFAVYAFNSQADNKWYNMTKQSDGTYKVVIDPDYDNIIFCAMNPNSTTNGWTAKTQLWYQTADIVISNLVDGTYTLNEIYLVPNSNWKESSARFAAYFMDSSKSSQTAKWVNMSDLDGDGVYVCEVPEGTWKYLLYGRLDPNTSSNGFSNPPLWNQTSDLTIPTNGNNCYTIAAGAWSKGSGTWSKK